MKDVSISTLKERAWNLLSKIVRLTGAEDGFNFCVTCWADDNFCQKKMVHWKKLQAGHFQAGRMNMILFDERGIFPQCVKCNFFNGGNRNAYINFLLHLHGKKKALALMEDLTYLSKRSYQFSTFELSDKIDGYKQRLAALLPDGD